MAEERQLTVAQEEARYHAAVSTEDYDRRRKILESQLRSEPDVAERAKARNAFEDAMRSRHIEARETRVREIAARQNQLTQGSLPLSALGSLAAGGLNAVDAATFGNLENLAGLVSEKAGQNIGASLDATRLTNPIAAPVGQVAGLFSPGGAGRILKGSGAFSKGALDLGVNLGARAVGKRGVQGLTALTVNRGFTPRAAAAIAQAGTTGAGAITTMSLLDDIDGDKTIGARLNEAWEGSTSLTNLAFSVGIGSLAARFGQTVDRERLAFVREFERKTGQKLTVDVITDNAEWQKFIDMAAHAPGMSSFAARTREKIFTGMRKMIRDMGNSRALGGSRESVRERAAAGVRRLTGGHRLESGKRAKGAVTEARRGPQRIAMAEGADDLLSVEATKGLRNGLREIMRGNKGRERRTGFLPIIKDTIRFTTKQVTVNGVTKRVPRQPTLAELENLRKQAGRLGFAGKGIDPLDPRLSERSRHEAKEYYHVLDEMIEMANTRYSSAVRSGERLRRAEEHLPVKQIEHLDDVLMDAFWAGDDVMQNISTLEQFGTRVEQQAAKGWYFWDMMSRVSNPKTGLVSADKLDKLLATKGQYNSEAVNRVLPGVIPEVRRLARLTEILNKGITHEENSSTASRASRQVATAAAGPALVAFITSMIYNPGATLATTLGTGGLAMLTRQLLKGVLDPASRVGRGLENLVLQRPPAPSRIPAALNEVREGFSQ